MKVARTIEELRDALAESPPSFVPTMGALHEGHLALIRRAAQLARPVVVSIFVNPKQFGPDEDDARYPRTPELDVKLAEAAGAEIIFMPDVNTMYPQGVEIAVPPLPAVATQPQLEDRHRPTHFAGVCQVVALLFDLIQPRVALFGEKDYQQLLVIKEMVKQAGDRWAGLHIEPHPTVRDPDGLALSSRNACLTTGLRKKALGVSRALHEAQKARDPGSAERIMKETLTSHNLVIDYAVVRDAESLMPIDSYHRPARALIATRLGEVRLIDNQALAAR